MKTLRYSFLLIFFVCTAGLGSARAQTFEWARLTRGAVDTAFVQPQASATDAAGNTYVAVTFVDSLRLGSIRLVGAHTWAQAVVKYNANGTAVWGKVLANIQVASLAADNSAGGVFVVAANRGGGTWGGVAVPTTAGANFYAKCSAAGTLQWSNSLPAAYYFGADDVVTDAYGGAYVSGTVQAASTVGGTPVAAADIFVLKTNNTGVTRWVRTFHTAYSVPLRLVLGPKPSGGFLLSGLLATINLPGNSNTLYQGTGATTPLISNSSVGGDGFISNFDSTGTHLWSRALVNTASAGTHFETTAVSAVAADAAGNCYLTGGTNKGASITYPMQLGGVALGTGFFLAKYGATGNLLWVRGAQAQAALPQNRPLSDYGLLLAPTASGVTVAVSSDALRNLPTVVIGTFSLTTPYAFVHYNALGDEQWAVADTWTFSATTVPPYFSPSGLGSDASGNLYPVGATLPSYGNNLAVVRLGAQTTVGKGTIVARLNAYANTLRGQVYFDQNANGQQDSGEGVFPRQVTGVLTQGSTTVYSAVGADGVLQTYATPGAYSLGLTVPVHYTVSQPGSGAYAGTFSGSNQLVSGQNFGIAPVANAADISVALVPYSNVRPGFTARYRLTVENLGTTTAGGTASATFDSHLTYISSTPSGTRTGQTVAWTYAGLAPFAKLEYDIILSLPTNVTTGTALLSAASAPLTGDVDLANNTASLPQTVVSSYDPNSIEVNYQRLTPAQVAAQELLVYTIHFQNLGTATASTVVVTDTLDYNKLDLNSLTRMAAQSHSCQWSLNTTGANRGLLTIRFLNINLPERNVDVIRSQGFVQFNIRPKNTLTVGEIIPNHAGIVFDYNAPVITNMATTTVFLATAALARHDAPAWSAYPNPATDAVTLAADLATAGPVRIELLDVLGRPVRQQSFIAPAGALRQTLNLSGLPAGIYMLRLTPPTGPASSRQVVRN